MIEQYLIKGKINGKRKKNQNIQLIFGDKLNQIIIKIKNN